MELRVVALTVLLGSFIPGPPPDQQMRTAVRLEGSLPSLRGAFRCVSGLNGKPYDEQQVKICLDSISALSYVQQAKIESNRMSSGEIFVEFVIEAQQLTVRHMNFGVESNEEKSIRDWIAKNPRNLRIGGWYTAEAEASTYQGIRQFYAAKGALVGVVPTVNLDFEKRETEIRFDIIEGPRIGRRPAYYPYGEICKDEIRYMDWSQVDEFVPVSLAESLITTNALGSCFDPERLRLDQEALSRSDLFKRAEINYSGSVGSRRVAFKLQGRELQVGRVAVKTFGREACGPDLEPGLALKANETYTRPKATLSMKHIEELCSQPDRWTEVSESDTQEDGAALDVTFNVLTFPLQTVFINGKKIE